MSATPDSLPEAPEGLDGFIGKWRARWPEWMVAEVFVPAWQRPVALAWATLQQELTDAAWGGDDARPGEAKLAWWQDELHGWAAGRRRHPLGSVLQRCPAPWTALAAALPVLQRSRERPQHAADAFDRLTPLASAASLIEQALFGPVHAPDQSRQVAPDSATPEAAATRLVGACMLQARLLRDGAAGCPLDVLAATGADIDAARAHWQRELLRHWPAAAATGATLPRRLWAAIARARLARGGAQQPLPPWATLWVAWRAAARD